MLDLLHFQEYHLTKSYSVFPTAVISCPGWLRDRHHSGEYKRLSGWLSLQRVGYKKNTAAITLVLTRGFNSHLSSSMPGIKFIK